MSFEVPKRTFRLIFEDNALDGCEVVCRSVSIAKWLGYSKLNSPSSMDDLQETLKSFGDDVIDSWNLTLEGKPVPATGEGLLTLPADVGRDLYQAWSNGVMAVPAPLDLPSSSGGSSQEQ